MALSAPIQNILVLENHNHIGDMLCSLPLFAALKKEYPTSHITLVVTPTSYQIPFFEINPYINEVLLFDKSTSTTLISFIKKLRSRKYQIGIVPSTKVVSRTLHIINFISGSKLRVGVKSIDGKKNKSHIFLNVKSDFHWKSKHQLDRNLEIAKQLGCNLTEDEMGGIKFNFLDEEIHFAKKYVDENFSDTSRMIIGFHPGSGKAATAWSTKNFIELITKLYSKYNNYVLITKGLVDNEVVDEVSYSLTKDKVPHKILNNCPIKKLGALLSNFNLYITNDTGTMHIAGFSGAKMISLFGPTDPKEWAPLSKNQFYIKSKSSYINDISVQEVFDHAKKMLSN